jgi:hypothetical protein
MLNKKRHITGRQEYISEFFYDDRKQGKLHNETRITILSDNATETMKRGKAARPDNKYIVMVELLKEFSIGVITDLCNDIYSTRSMSIDLRTLLFITLPKTIRAKESNDFRSVSLMSSHQNKIIYPLNVYVCIRNVDFKNSEKIIEVLKMWTYRTIGSFLDREGNKY